MDHHTHLAFVINAHLFGCIVIVDLIYHLDLSIVITCTQRAQLQQNTEGQRTYRTVTCHVFTKNNSHLLTDKIYTHIHISKIYVFFIAR